MPTLCGLRRRGYPPEAIINFCNRIGVDKTNSTVEIEMLEYYVREELNKTAHRVMGVVKPLKVVLTNYPEGQTEEFEAENNPEDPAAGKRKLAFARTLYIEQEDFREDPPKGYFRLSPGKEVRLKHAYYITCQTVVKDAAGNITELHCTYDPESRGGGTPDNRKVQGTLHWVSAQHALDAEVRWYEHLFSKANPDDVPEGQPFTDNLNPNSLAVLPGAKVEPALAQAQPGERFQFLRQGYFCVDPDSQPGHLIFNRIVGLKDTWAKVEKKQK
jgi:glutaminyl-tRNA synthetase